MNRFKKNNLITDFGIVILLVILFVVFSMLSPNFLTFNTAITILRQVSITGIISFGMTFVILTGGIDLSVGSIAGVSSVIAALLMSKGISISLTILITLLLAVIFGTVNGILITKINLPPLIATLGTQTSLRGLSFIITAGLPVFGFSKVFGNFAKGFLFRIPWMVWFALIIFIITKFILDNTVLGSYIYGVGGNEEATWLSGINVTRIKMLCYSLSGFLAGVAGLILLSRTNSGQPSAGMGYEMDAITAVVLGGISLTGGKGRISQVLVGVLIIGTLSTGMIMIGINDYVQQLVKGIVLILAVTLSVISDKKRSEQ